ncbi:Kelch repeat type 1 [Dillenia turbinata]|uniref:Kelch repeat type 1 n=1 Tax=Dillenia turbinata TaxID=194707 RepID=A0AAN8VFG3_9MAGN
MGSLSPTPPPPTPPPSPEIPLDGYRVYASFCMREPSCCKVSNWIECFDPTNNTWSHASPIPGLMEDHVLKDFAMVSIGDSIFVIGGRLCHKGYNFRESPSYFDKNSEVLSCVWRYHISTDQWFRCASLSVPRYNFACALCDNKVYVAGGQSTSGCARGISSAEVYDPSVDTYKCVGVTWQGKIHVVGGFADKGDWDRQVKVIYGPERSSADVYNPQTGRWEYVAGMWQLDVPPNQIVAVGDTLFSSGDCLNPWKGHIEAYDGKLNMWNVVDGSQQESLSSPISTSDAGVQDPRPRQRLYLTMAPIGSRLLFFAGYRMNGEFSRSISMVHAFDINAETYAWTSFEPTKEEGEKELCTHCCVVQMSRC